MVEEVQSEDRRERSGRESSSIWRTRGDEMRGDCSGKECKDEEKEATVR